MSASVSTLRQWLPTHPSKDNIPIHTSNFHSPVELQGSENVRVECGWQGVKKVLRVRQDKKATVVAIVLLRDASPHVNKANFLHSKHNRRAVISTGRRLLQYVRAVGRQLVCPHTLIPPPPGKNHVHLLLVVRLLYVMLACPKKTRTRATRLHPACKPITHILGHKLLLLQIRPVQVCRKLGSQLLVQVHRQVVGYCNRIVNP